jgi:hypothetical protein
LGFVISLEIQGCVSRGYIRKNHQFIPFGRQGSGNLRSIDGENGKHHTGLHSSQRQKSFQGLPIDSHRLSLDAL